MSLRNTRDTHSFGAMSQNYRVSKIIIRVWKISYIIDTMSILTLRDTNIHLQDGNCPHRPGALCACRPGVYLPDLATVIRVVVNGCIHSMWARVPTDSPADQLADACLPGCLTVVLLLEQTNRSRSRADLMIMRALIVCGIACLIATGPTDPDSQCSEDLGLLRVQGDLRHHGRHNEKPMQSHVRAGTEASRVQKHPPTCVPADGATIWLFLLATC